MFVPATCENCGALFATMFDIGPGVTRAGMFGEGKFGPCPRCGKHEGRIDPGFYTHRFVDTADGVVEALEIRSITDRLALFVGALREQNEESLRRLAERLQTDEAREIRTSNELAAFLLVDTPFVDRSWLPTSGAEVAAYIQALVAVIMLLLTFRKTRPTVLSDANVAHIVDAVFSKLKASPSIGASGSASPALPPKKVSSKDDEVERKRKRNAQKAARKRNRR